MRNGSSIIDLIKEFTQEAKLFVREEFQLAKTEMSEKVSGYTKHAVTLAIGGVVGYAGLLIFLGGIGALIAYAFNRAGLDPLLAGFLGLGIIGLVVIAIGAVMLVQGLNALKKDQLAPARTISTLQNLKGSEGVTEMARSGKHEHKDKRSSSQIQASVFNTEQRMAETLAELTERVTWRHAREQATAEVRSHPYRWGLIAAGCGAASSFVLKRKLAKA